MNKDSNIKKLNLSIKRKEIGEHKIESRFKMLKTLEVIYSKSKQNLKKKQDYTFRKRSE